jgi:hypothetical protein
MTEPNELESLLAPIRAKFHAKRRDVVTLCDEIASLLTSYRQAVDNSILRELANTHGLPSPSPSTDVRRLALALLDKVQSLPENRQLIVPQQTASTDGAPPNAPSRATLPSVRTAPNSAAASWPLVRKALAQHPLVIVGGQPHVERLTGLNLETQDRIEWVDTTRKGTHAIGNLEHRIKDKRVAALLILEGLVQHRHSDPLVSTARHAEVPLVYGGKGGKQAIVHALDELEKMLQQRA